MSPALVFERNKRYLEGWMSSKDNSQSEKAGSYPFCDCCGGIWRQKRLMKDGGFLDPWQRTIVAVDLLPAKGCTTKCNYGSVGN